MKFLINKTLPTATRILLLPLTFIHFISITQFQLRKNLPGNSLLSVSFKITKYIHLLNTEENILKD